MEIKLSKVQTAIAKESRKFLQKECAMERVREMFDDPAGYSEAVWDKMGELDWMNTCIPEAYDGAGMDQLDLCIILEEMGRVLVPEPFFSTVLLTGGVIMAAGSDDQKKRWLPKIGTGEVRGTLALSEIDGGADPGYVQMAAAADGDGFILSGTKAAVTDAQAAEIMVVAARTTPGEDPEKGITLFLVDPKAAGVEMELLPNMDGTRKLSMVIFKDVKVPGGAVLGAVNQGWGPLSTAMDRANVGLCAECIGGAQRAMEMAVEYAKTRVAYGKPIGAYQSIKHMCAEMYVGVESARSLVYWAAWAQDHGDERDAALAAAAAKVHTSTMYKDVCANTIQIHGGVGVTLEYDPHLYLRRAKESKNLLGDATYHREQIVRLFDQK